MLKKKGSGHVGEVLIPSSANLQPPETDIQMPFWGETYLDGIAALCPCRKPTGRWRYRDGKTAAGETPTGDTDVPSRNRHPNVRFQSNYSLVNRGNMHTAPLPLSTDTHAMGRAMLPCSCRDFPLNYKPLFPEERLFINFIFSFSLPPQLRPLPAKNCQYRCKSLPTPPRLHR